MTPLILQNLVHSWLPPWHWVQLEKWKLILVQSSFCYFFGFKISKIPLSKMIESKLIFLSSQIKWKFYFTLVCLNSRMANSTEFLEFPIFRKIDVFRNPKIPDFQESRCFVRQKMIISQKTLNNLVRSSFFNICPTFQTV